MFDDVLPAGHILVNYADKTDHDHPTIEVQYGPTGGAYIQGFYKTYSINQGTTHIQKDIGGTVYNDDGTVRAENVGLNKQDFVITYYTYITDEEWNRITSSLTGTQTYENTATIDVDGEQDFNATGEVTVTSNGYIWKEDTTQENSQGIVIDTNGNTTDTLSYQIDINPYAMKLVSEENATLTLTDRISTNMDLDTENESVIIEYSSTKYVEGQEEEWHRISEDPARFGDVKVSYNDDTRYLTILNLPDEVHIRLTYNTVVRAQGEDTYVNTATLTGGGSHSATTNEKHVVQKSGGNISGNTSSIQLRKIDENNISVKVAGATFEIYRCELSNLGAWMYATQDPLSNSNGTINYTEGTHINFNEVERVVPNSYKGYEGGTAEEKEKLAQDFKIVNRTRIATVVSDGNGMITSPVLHEETLYYWVETATADGFTAELNVPHYFVVYQLYDDDGVLLDLETSEKYNGENLKEWETRQWRGWALDDAAQYANDITVASLSTGNTWTVNNQESEYTSISATKQWKDDFDNFYETRPTQGIQLILWKEGDDGTRVQEGPIVPINVDEDGNWPTYVWQNLPKESEVTNADGTKTTVHYTYWVEELPVEGYTTEYSNSEPVETGEIVITNKLIPLKTDISVKKVFDQDSIVYPDQVIAYLYEITNYTEGGKEPTRIQRSSYALTAENNWSYTWKNLPTKDDSGNVLTYTVVEDLHSLGSDVSYTVEYSDNGEGVASAPVDNPLVITNRENGLEIRKSFGGDIDRLLDDSETAQAMRAQIQFTVTDGQEGHIVFFNINDMDLVDGEYVFRMTSTRYPWITKDAHVTVTEQNTLFTNTELRAVTYTINGGENVTVNENIGEITAQVVLTGGADTVEFYNEYYEDTVDLTINKKWLKKDGDPEVEEDYTGWPEGVSEIVFYLTADEGDGPQETGDTVTLTKERYVNDDLPWVMFTDLPKYVLNTDTEIQYSVTEIVDGYETIISDTVSDSDGDLSVTVTNKKAHPRLYVQKIWEGSTDFIPDSLTIDLYKDNIIIDKCINTITISAADGWKGYFETDAEGNELVEGTKYYIQERGVGGWTLSGYSDNNGQEFVDLETITVTNIRNSGPDEDKTSVSVQKKWTVNGEPADSKDWEPVEVQLIRYQVENAKGTTVEIIYNNGNEPFYTGIKKTISGNATIDLNYDGTGESWFDGEFNYSIYAVDLHQYQYTYNFPSASSSGVSDKGSITINLNDVTYQDSNCVYIWLQDRSGYSAQDKTEPTINGEEPILPDEAEWSYSTVVLYEETNKQLLNSDNSWQIEYTNLPVKSADGQYLYKYAVQEIIPEDAAYSTEISVEGGETITLEEGTTADVGGNTVITNNKIVQKGEIIVVKHWEDTSGNDASEKSNVKSSSVELQLQRITADSPVNEAVGKYSFDIKAISASDSSNYSSVSNNPGDQSLQVGTWVTIRVELQESNVENTVTDTSRWPNSWLKLDGTVISPLVTEGPDRSDSTWWRSGKVYTYQFEVTGGTHSVIAQFDNSNAYVEFNYSADSAVAGLTWENVGSPVTIHDRDGWTAVFEDLDLKDESNKDYIYRVVEINKGLSTGVYYDSTGLKPNATTPESNVINVTNIVEDENPFGYEFPSTGGLGNLMLLLFGVALILTAGGGTLLMKRREMRYRRR